MPTDKECLYMVSCDCCAWVERHIGFHECKLPKEFYGLTPWQVQEKLVEMKAKKNK